jgi:hypothetical protein
MAMRTLRWIAAGLLMWGLFTGIGFVLVPVLTDGWGNTASLLAGVGLIVVCVVALLRLDPRQA